MFAEIDTVQINPRRRWTALVSFTLQAALLAAALVLPLLAPQSLPDAFTRKPIFVPMSASEIPVTPSNQVSQPGHAGAVAYAHALIVNRDNGVHFSGLRAGTLMTEGPPNLLLSAMDPTGPGGPNLGQLLVPPVHPLVLPHQPPVSVMMQGNLIYRIEPVYPTLAKTTGVQGAVFIKAVVSAQGGIEQAQVISGSPVLARAAVDAIKQWRYRPYYLNGVPVEVGTEITVNFVLR